MKTYEITTLTGAKYLVSEEDLREVSKRRWRLNKRGYLITEYRMNGKRHIEYMHRVIMKPPKGMVVDHIDGNKSNNTRENLRICTQKENTWNQRQRRTDLPKGVTLLNTGRWQAQIGINGRHYFLGTYSTADDAATAYRVVSKVLHGEFARQ